MLTTNENLEPKEEFPEPNLSVQSSLPPDAVYYNSVSYKQATANSDVKNYLIQLISQSYSYKDFQNRCSELLQQFKNERFLLRRLFTVEECSPFLLKIEELKKELLLLEKENSL